MRISKKLIFIATGFILVAVVAAGIYLFSLKHKDLSRVRADEVMQATELISRFETDESLASANLVDKVVEVTGRVASTETGPEGTVTITLREEDAFSGVICTFPSLPAGTLENISTGQTIVVRGECSGYLMDVLLNNCALVSQQAP